MAKNVVIRDVVYGDVPSVDIPLAAGGGNAVFVDTSDATLDDAGHLPLGETAYADGTKYTGTAPMNDSGDLTSSGATVTAPAGFYEEAASKTIPSGSATPPASISATGATVTPGNGTLKLSKSVSVTPQVSPGYVAQGTAGSSAVELTAPVTTKGAATVTPGTSNQTIASGTYLTGTQTIQGDSNLKAENIVSGKSIFNVAGTAKIPIISQDSTTKVLSIS